MKKITLTCSLLAFASVAVFAQSNVQSLRSNETTSIQRPQPSQEDITKRQTAVATNMAKSMQQHYGLSQEQYDKVYVVCLENSKKMEAMRASGKQPSREEFQKIMDERNAGFKAIFTPQQYAQFAASLPHPAPTQAPQSKN
jgi:hypothetical protein